MSNLVSLTYYPEQAEEEARLATCRQFCLPERWWVPVPEVRSAFTGRTRTLRRPQATRFKVEGLFRRPPTNRDASMRPIYASEIVGGNLREWMVKLFDLDYRHIFEVYDRIVAEDRQTLGLLLPTVVGQLAWAGRFNKAATRHIADTFVAINKAKGCAIAASIMSAVSVS